MFNHIWAINVQYASLVWVLSFGKADTAVSDTETLFSVIVVNEQMT